MSQKIKDAPNLSIYYDKQKKKYYVKDGRGWVEEKYLSPALKRYLHLSKNFFKQEMKRKGILIENGVK